MNFDGRIAKSVVVPEVSVDFSLDGTVKFPDYLSTQDELAFIKGNELYYFDSQNKSPILKTTFQELDTNFKVYEIKSEYIIFDYGTFGKKCEIYNFDGVRVNTVALPPNSLFIGFSDDYMICVPQDDSGQNLSMYSISLSDGTKTMRLENAIDSDGGFHVFGNDFLFYEKKSDGESVLKRLNLKNFSANDIDSGVWLRQMEDVPRLCSDYLISHNKIYSSADYSFIKDATPALNHIVVAPDDWEITEDYTQGVWGDYLVRHISYWAKDFSSSYSYYGLYDSKYGVGLLILYENGANGYFKICEDGIYIALNGTDGNGNPITRISRIS